MRLSAVASQDSSLREFLDSALTDKSSKKPQYAGRSTAAGHSTGAGQKSSSTLNQDAVPFKSSGSTGHNSSTPNQAESPFKGSLGSTGQTSSTPSQGESPFKGSSGSGTSGSTVTTGAPAFNQKQGNFCYTSALVT